MKIFALASTTSASGTRTAGRRAFTIIELVVAMGIATVMLTLINQIFFQTTNAVSRGIGLSHIIGESRAISSTLETDFIANQITKPTAGGFMFIGFKTYNNVDFANPRRQVGTAIQQTVQSDQMLLTLDIASQTRTPLTPRDDDSFSPFTFSPTPNNAFLWYGHVARLNPVDPTAGTPGGTDAGEIDNPTRNRFGHQWIVGRQLMFLDPNMDTVATPTLPAYVNGLYSRSFVVNYTVPAAVTPVTRWMGLSDIIDASLDNYTGPTPAILTDAAAISDISYLAQVARVSYVTERLRVAATVEPGTTPANSYPSWNLAQTHAAFMSFCSDFQISFAGDFDTDAGIDIEQDIVGSGSVAIPEFPGGNIKWYGFPANIPATAGFDPAKPNIYNPDPAAVAPANNFNGGAVGDPYFNDEATIRAEIDSQLSASLPPLQVDQGIVFRHDASDVTKQWPHLIRIRYRLHDERGEIESTNGTTRAQGIWFEQIVRIQ